MEKTIILSFLSLTGNEYLHKSNKKYLRFKLIYNLLIKIFSKLDFCIKKISPDETRDIRKLTLRPHQEPYQLIYSGDDNKKTVHFGLFFNEKLSGTASIYNEPLNGDDNQFSWRLRGMATTEDIRGKGFGTKLMNECLNYIKSKNAGLFWCNARLTAESFYNKFGMNRKGEVFTPEGMGEHVIMVLKMKLSN